MNSHRKVLTLPHKTIEQHNSMPFEMQPFLQQHVHEYLVSQQQRLMHLDKHTVKKIITHAENSLMNFMKSKAKINCFKTKDNNTHIRNNLTHTVSHPQHIFNQKKLQQHIQKEQKNRTIELKENSPLVQSALRQVVGKDGSVNNRKWQMKVMQNQNEQYCSLSRRKQHNKIYL